MRFIRNRAEVVCASAGLLAHPFSEVDIEERKER